MKPLRVGRRFLLFCTFALIQFTKCRISCHFIRDSELIYYRAAWLNRSCRYLIKLFDIRLRFHGNIPADGLLVCNHLSYLDIIALAAIQPMIFISKSEVRRWPGIGMLAECGGTIFIDRDDKRKLARSIKMIENVISRGVIVCLFAEGTSSGGTSVLPFRSSLFASAISTSQMVTPARISYSITRGSVTNEICYWGKMVFLPHFLNLLANPWIDALLVYDVAINSSDRKTLAKITYDTVQRLEHFVNNQLSTDGDLFKPNVVGEL